MTGGFIDNGNSDALKDRATAAKALITAGDAFKTYTNLEEMKEKGAGYSRGGGESGKQESQDYVSPGLGGGLVEKYANMLGNDSEYIDIVDVDLASIDLPIDPCGIIHVGMKINFNVSLKINDGEFVFLVGPSGSGKSTIVKLLTAELHPTKGSVHVNGFDLERIKKKQIPYMRRTVGVIFQDFRLVRQKTVYENVAFAMRVIGASEREIRSRVPYVLQLVGLEEKGKHLPDELSGGEQQRVAIARALVNNPSMIIADEPTGNLDPVKSLEIMLLLEQINALGTTVMIVTHEAEMVNRFHRRVIAIDAGHVVSDGMDGYYINEEE